MKANKIKNLDIDNLYHELDIMRQEIGHIFYYLDPEEYSDATCVLFLKAMKILNLEGDFSLENNAVGEIESLLLLFDAWLKMQMFFIESDPNKKRLGYFIQQRLVKFMEDYLEVY